MKKRIIAIVLVLVLTLSVFSGCTLIEEDESKVLAQAIVTIGTGENTQTVTHEEVINTFSSVSYIYMYYFGMTADEVMYMVIDGLQTQKVFLYAALEQMEKITESDNLYEQYLTAEEIAAVYADAEQMIATEIDALEYDALQESFVADGATLTEITSRTLPDWADTTTAIPADFSGTLSRTTAIASYNRTLSSYGYTYDGIYESCVDSLLQSAVTTKYQTQIADEYNLSDSDVQISYNAQLADELEYYAAYGLDSYMTKYDTDYSTVIYNPTGESYGYVKHILVPFADTDSLTDLEGDELDAARLALAEETIASDLRDSYLLLYGYNTEGDGLFSRYDFDGTVTADTIDGVQIKDEEGNYSYSEITANEYVGFEEFLDEIVNPYLGGVATGEANGFTIYDSEYDNDKIDNLIFAYNTDTGVFNTDYGYFVPDDSFYEEFNAAATSLLEYGEGAYTICLTDYGYHIVYLTKVVSADEINSLVLSEIDVEGTFSYYFATSVRELAKTAYFDERVTEIVTEYEEMDIITFSDSAYEKMISMYS